MLRTMLQQLLTDRYHLAVHRESHDAPVYLLQVTKQGAKLQEAGRDDPYPTGDHAVFPNGGMFIPEGNAMHFYKAPMTLLASLLTNRNLNGRPVLDRTGLSGRYNFVVQWGAWTGGVGAAGGDAADPGPTLSEAVKPLGLMLLPAAAPVEELIIDRVERPSGN